MGPAHPKLRPQVPPEFQLSADITSLPCAFLAMHSYKDGEQRTMTVLFNAIKESRWCVLPTPAVLETRARRKAGERGGKAVQSKTVEIYLVLGLGCCGRAPAGFANR